MVHSALCFIIGCNQTHHCIFYEKSEYCFIYKSIRGLTPSYLALGLSNTNVQYNNLQSNDLLYAFTLVN